MRKISAILSAVTFSSCFLGLFYFDDLQFEFTRIYIPFIILGILSLLLFVILLVQFREEGAKLFSKFLGFSILSFIILLIVFPFGLAIYKKQTGFQSKKEIQIKGYEKMIEKLYSMNDDKIASKINDRFIDLLDSNKKFDCYIQFDSVEADIDLLPDYNEKDSFNFLNENWDKNEFNKFFHMLKTDCLNGNIDSIDFNAMNEVLFNGSDNISVEISEIMRKDTMQELTFIIHGNNSYTIISYNVKLNNNISAIQK